MHVSRRPTGSSSWLLISFHHQKLSLSLSSSFMPCLSPSLLWFCVDHQKEMQIKPKRSRRRRSRSKESVVIKSPFETGGVHFCIWNQPLLFMRCDLTFCFNQANKLPTLFFLLKKTLTSRSLSRHCIRRESVMLQVNSCQALLGKDTYRRKTTKIIKSIKRSHCFWERHQLSIVCWLVESSVRGACMVKNSWSRSDIWLKAEKK